MTQTKIIRFVSQFFYGTLYFVADGKNVNIFISYKIQSFSSTVKLYKETAVNGLADIFLAMMDKFSDRGLIN